MDGSIRITDEQRKRLLKIVRSKSGNEVRRALIVLHAASGKSYRWIAEALLTAFVRAKLLEPTKTPNVAAVIVPNVTPPSTFT
jgi:hypothetical protein